MAQSKVQEKEKRFVFTSKNVEDITRQINDGVIIKRFQNPWFKNEVGVRRSGITFALTDDEIQEYIKCKLDIHYFAEKYCCVKTEDGSIGNIKLRDYQKDILDLYCNGRFSILCGSRQIGKALRNNSNVWTINGKKNIGDLSVGDKIFGDDGILTNVTGVFPQGKKQLYKIKFSDNSEVECCGEHLWEVYKYGRPRVLELNDIKDNYLNKRGDYKYYVKVAPCVEYNQQELPIDPYLLGLLIGDGGISNSSNIITSTDKEIIDYVTEISKNYNCTINHINRNDYRISTLNHGENELTNNLRDLGLRVKSEFKFIPNKYLISSKNQRVSLLQGLMDTDGYCSKKGVVEFSTISKNLSDNFQELCNSLGIKTKCVERTTWYNYKGEKKFGKKSYRIRLYIGNIDFDIFKLNRKNINVNKNMKFNWSRFRGIAAIEKIEIDECTCISVDNNSKLFLTNNFIPTHNTISAAITMLHFITFNNDKNIMIVANIANTAIEIIDKIKSIYILLPFFLKVGIKNWNQRSVIFDNGCRIKSSARTKTPAIGFTIDFLYMDEFAHIPPNIIESYYTAAYPTVSAIENSKIIITSTPNGMNLFYRLLTDAERPAGDPQKNNYRAMRVYWYQVPGRFVTYYRLNLFKLQELGITDSEIFQQVEEAFSSLTTVFMKYNLDLDKNIIHVLNNDSCTEQMARSFQFIDSNGMEIPIQMLAQVTTWKEESMKDIGGEDAFNQEYGLRFVNSSRSLLTESTIEYLMSGKKNYIFEDIYEFTKMLRFSYGDLKWVDDDSIFMPIQRRSVRGIFSIDISEGLGQDYSVINIFKIAPKSRDIIELQKHTYTSISDFFCLVQIGIFRSNLISVKQLAELFYLLAFEYFDYENFKAVLEINTYGNEFLAHLPHLFDGNNNYGSSIFFRYKHRSDSPEEKLGLKVGENKNMLVKDYQDAMDKRNFVINNEDCIREITTFVKHVTPAGNIRYAADIGNDDTVMTLVNAASSFSKYQFVQMCEDFANTQLDKESLNYFNEILRQVEYRESADYSSIINVNKQRRLISQYKNRGVGNNWFTNK